MNVYIETERLIIRPLEPDDAEGMLVMEADAEVHRYIGRKPVTDIAHVRNAIDFIRQQYVDNGIGRWAMTDKAGQFVGWIGFKLLEGPVNGHRRFIDFGYRLARAHWNKGYASEGGRASLEYGTGELGFKDVYAMTDTGNGASRRVLEKLGFELLTIFPYDAEPNWREPNAPTTWYKLKEGIY